MKRGFGCAKPQRHDFTTLCICTSPGVRTGLAHHVGSAREMGLEWGGCTTLVRKMQGLGHWALTRSPTLFFPGRRHPSVARAERVTPSPSHVRVAGDAGGREGQGSSGRGDDACVVAAAAGWRQQQLLQRGCHHGGWERGRDGGGGGGGRCSDAIDHRALREQAASQAQLPVREARRSSTNAPGGA
jgi:hypothetical protein